MRVRFWGKSTGHRKTEGEILPDGNDVINRWNKYFQDLYNVHKIWKAYLNSYQSIREPNGENIPPTTEEVLQAIKKLKNNRALGQDGLNAELIKVDDNKLNHRICKVTENIPQQLNEGLICPILKMGDRLVYENYRGITLLNTAYKVFSNILFERLQPYVEKITRSDQWGFRSGKATSDQIHMVREIMEKVGQYGVSTF
jgi:hypothetical protein